MNLKGITWFFLALWLIVSYNSEFASMSMPGIGLGVNVVLEAILVLLTIPLVFRSPLNAYKVWTIIILVFWGLSTRWSANPEAFSSYYKFTFPYLLCFCLSSKIATKKDVERLLTLDLIAALLCCIYVLLFVNTGNLADEGRLGQAEGESVWNANDIGLKMALGYVVCVYFLLKGSKNKPLLLGLITLFLLVCFMSGSRKVFILLVMFTALLMLTRYRGHNKVRVFMLIVLFLVVVYIAVMNVPVLYELLGRRIELMLEGLQGGDGGYSMQKRSLMIAYGIEFWMESPWIGRGFNAFSKLFGDLTGWYAYAHNNFVDLLANTGVIGLFLYYSLTIYILKSLWKPALQGKELLALVLFLYTFISTILDYAMVSYVDIPTVFRLMYTTMYCQIVKEQTCTNIITTKNKRKYAKS